MSKIFKILVLSVMLFTTNLASANAVISTETNTEIQYDVANFEYQKNQKFVRISDFFIFFS